MPFRVCKVNTETEQLHGVIKDIHSAKKFFNFFLELNFTKRGETIFGYNKTMLLAVGHD